MKGKQEGKGDISSQKKLEELEILRRHLENDLFLTRTENHENALKYLELLTELNMKKAEIEVLRQSLADMAREREKESGGDQEC